MTGFQLRAVPNAEPGMSPLWALFRLIGQHEVQASPQPERFSVLLNVAGPPGRRDDAGPFAGMASPPDGGAIVHV